MNLPEPTVKYHIQLLNPLTKLPTGQILIVSKSTYDKMNNLVQSSKIKVDFKPLKA